jgi:hypothetical protein
LSLYIYIYIFHMHLHTVFLLCNTPPDVSSLDEWRI